MQVLENYLTLIIQSIKKKQQLETLKITIQQLTTKAWSHLTFK